MKKSAFLALACAALVSGSALAQSATEIVYVEDPAQGYTFNRFKDNWFITAEVGANVAFTSNDGELGKLKRIAPAFEIDLGKWFSPILGVRAGLSCLGMKGATSSLNSYGILWKGNKPETTGTNNRYYKTNVAELGGDLDVLVNVTNWWCGYKPNRFYNFIAYGGGGAYFALQQKIKNGATDGWDTGSRDTSLFIRAGVINSVNISEQVALSLDLRFTAISAPKEGGYSNAIAKNVSALLGVTYLFNQRTWTAPIVPVIPVIEDCDPIKARLAECEAKLEATQKQLRDCLNRPAPETTRAGAATATNCVAPLATCYFRIGSATVSSIDRNVLKSVAATMKTTKAKYDVCGWADNYTGTDAVNARLRTNRANNVKNILVNNGVSADQLNVTTNPGDRYTGKENVYLDRCVTIQEVK